MQQKDTFNRFQKFLKETDGEFHILEKQISVDLQMEYFQSSDRLRKKNRSKRDFDLERYVSELQNPESTKEYKQEILSTLAISKEVKSYRVLEAYIKQADSELLDWAYMALMESRIMLETELSDEKQIYISTGMGGKGQKLRFFILLLSSEGAPFLDYQQRMIRHEFEYAFAKLDCEIERLTIKERHVEMVVLMPIRLDIKQTMDNIIHECNQYGSFLSPVFTVTNMKELDEQEIGEIIRSHVRKRKDR